MNPHRVCAAFVSGLMLAAALSFPATAEAQTNYYGTNGTEYAVIGALPGDQTFPDVSLNNSGGFVAWQDNITDGDNLGISARRLDSTLSGTLGTFRVNADGAGVQENVRVAMLKNGGAAFVWQGGKLGFQHISARFLTSSNTFTTGADVRVNTFSNNFQINPALAVLNNSNVVIVWASYNQAAAGAMQDVYGQILSPAGQKIGGEFLINQVTAFNQRTPSVVALAGGGFAVAWVSEQQRSLATAPGSNYVYATASAFPSVDIYLRQFNSNGVAVASEQIVNTDNNPSANPAMVAAGNGTFMVVWTSLTAANTTNTWDISGRIFNSAFQGGTMLRINSFLPGAQTLPRLSAVGNAYFVSWDSEGQDGSGTGVYARVVQSDGSFSSAEFRVNTTTISHQFHPSVSSDGANQFLVVWSGFSGLANKFDLYAQRYLNSIAPLQPMSAPFVWNPFVVSNNVYQPRLQVSWSPLLGLAISNYEVYVDGASSPVALVTSNQWTMTGANGLLANSTRCFQVDYVTTDGRRSPISPSACGTTWGGQNWGGIPYEWMAAFFGGYFNGNYTTTFWPASSARIVAGGPTLLQIFKSGGNPYDSGTWLRQTLTKTSQGLFLNWNTQPGATYQVQSASNLGSPFVNFGSPRFAAGTNDSINVGGSAAGYYQLILMR